MTAERTNHQLVATSKKRTRQTLIIAASRESWVEEIPFLQINDNLAEGNIEDYYNNIEMQYAQKFYDEVKNVFAEIDLIKVAEVSGSPSRFLDHSARKKVFQNYAEREASMEVIDKWLPAWLNGRERAQSDFKISLETAAHMSTFIIEELINAQLHKIKTWNAYFFRHGPKQADGFLSEEGKNQVRMHYDETNKGIPTYEPKKDERMVSACTHGPTLAAWLYFLGKKIDRNFLYTTSGKIFKDGLLGYNRGLNLKAALIYSDELKLKDQVLQLTWANSIHEFTVGTLTEIIKDYNNECF